MSTYKLVVAEKPSVAKSIGEVLGAKSKRDGYYEGANYIITWCVGHLLELAPPDAYDGKYTKWRIADLPILPEVYKHNPTERTKNQLRIIKDLLKRPDIEAVINACDAGREGELIFRLVYDHCKCKKSLHRLWISSLETSAIRDGFKNLRKGSDYDNLHQAALCRQKADWAVGMNYSRLFGCLYNGRISIGRVQTPTLAMIVERETKINNFVKEPFYIVEIAGGELVFGGCLVAAREKLPDKAQAENIREKCDGKTATITSVKRQEKSEAPQKLYDLTTLQREANRLFGYTAADTLQAAQSLYEKKLLTYPRTDSRFISDDMAAGIPMLVADSVGILQAIPLPIAMNEEDLNGQKGAVVGAIKAAQVVNNAKVTDHHAIIPTSAAAKANISALPERERNILLLVCMRLASAVSARHRYAETVITVECENEKFTARGRTVLHGGWKAIEQVFAQHFRKPKSSDRAKLNENAESNEITASNGKTKPNEKAKPSEKNDEKPLPIVTEGQQFTAAASIREGSSQPPPHFTEDLLLKAMENAGVDDMPEATEDMITRPGIGTPATRAETIEKLLRTGYVERKEKKILPTEKGYELIKVLPDNDPIKSALLTAEWETNLKKVEAGELLADFFMGQVSTYVTSAIANNATVRVSSGALSRSGTGADTGTGVRVGFAPRESIGKCPRCENNVTENSKGFCCASEQCKFALWKDNRFFTAKKKQLTKDVAVALLNEGQISMKGLHSERTGKTYNATIFLADNPDGYPGFRMEFEKR